MQKTEPLFITDKVYSWIRYNVSSKQEIWFSRSKEIEPMTEVYVDTFHKLETLKDTFSDNLELGHVLTKLLSVVLNQYLSSIRTSWKK